MSKSNYCVHVHRGNSQLSSCLKNDKYPRRDRRCDVRHFIPVFDSLKRNKATYAKDVSIGDTVMMVGANGPASGTVVAKHLTISKGLYNPYTKVQILKCFSQISYPHPCHHTSGNSLSVMQSSMWCPAQRRRTTKHANHLIIFAAQPSSVLLGSESEPMKGCSYLCNGLQV